MPYVERKVQKLYYTIGEVAKMFEVNTSLIRFWEREFDEIKPKKNKKGNRLFTKDDIDLITEIYKLVKQNGFTLEGAKRKLKEPKMPLHQAADNKTQPSSTDLLVKLQAIKVKLETISASL